MVSKIKSSCECKFTGNEPSPKGFGKCAHCTKPGTMHMGADGRVWIVKKMGTKKTNRWIVSDFQKDFDKVVKSLIKELKKSPVKYKIQTIQEFAKRSSNNIHENIENGYNPLMFMTISYPLDDLGSIIGSLDFDRIACKTGFYRYVINIGNDVGPLSRNKDIIPNRSQDYEINPDFKVWSEKEFNKLCQNYKKESTDILKKDERVNKLPLKQKNYIKKYF